MTQAEAREYFTDYASAFDAFDAEAIAEFLHLPCTIVNPDATYALTKRDHILRNFEGVNEMHKQQGYDHAALIDCDVRPTYHDACVEARTKWRFLRADGSTIYVFRMGYVLGRFDDEWKIIVALNLDDSHANDDGLPLWPRA